MSAPARPPSARCWRVGEPRPGGGHLPRHLFRQERSEALVQWGDDARRLVIANSDFTRDHILRQHRIDLGRVVVVPEGVDEHRFDPRAVAVDRIAQMRERLGARDGAALILIAARLTDWKGQWVAIEALARLETPAVLALVGRAESDAYLGRLRALAARLGVADRVSFVGDIEDMPAALAAADLVLAPSTSPESFGRGVVEAAMMQRPVIASDLGAHRETVEAEVTGWLTPPARPSPLPLRSIAPSPCRTTPRRHGGGGAAAGGRDASAWRRCPRPPSPSTAGFWRRG